MFSKIANPFLNRFLKYVRLSGKMLVKEPKRKITLHRKYKARVALVHDPAYDNTILLYTLLLNIIFLSSEIAHIRLFFSGFSTKAGIFKLLQMLENFIWLDGWFIF